MKSKRRYLLILLIFIFVGVLRFVFLLYNSDGRVIKADIIKSLNRNSQAFTDVAEYLSEIEGEFTILKKNGKYIIYAAPEYLDFDNCPVKDQFIFMLSTLKYQRIEKGMTPKTIVFYRYFGSGKVDWGLMFLKGNYCSLERENFLPDFEKLKDEWYYFSLPYYP